jgi:hypothetical protein
MRREKHLQEGKAAGRGGRQLFKHRSMSVSLPVAAPVRASGWRGSTKRPAAAPGNRRLGPMSIAYPFPALRTRAILPRNVARLGLSVEGAAQRPTGAGAGLRRGTPAAPSASG